MFLVQDDLPLPKIDRSPKAPRRKFPVADMVVGQAFFVPGKTSKSVSAYISRITKHLPGKYTARHEWCRSAGKTNGATRWKSCAPDAAGAQEGVTVMRVE